MSSSSQDKVVCVHAHGHPKNRALTEAITAAQGALAWHGTGLPACSLSARLLDLNTVHRSGWGVWRKPFLWQGGLPFPHSSWKGGTRSGWRKRMAGLVKLPFLGFVSCRPAQLATQRANRTFERLSAPACSRPHTDKVLL